MYLQRLEVVCLCMLHLWGCFVSRTLGLDIDHWGTNFVLTFPRSLNGAQNMVVITAREVTEVRVTSHQTGEVTAFTLNEGEAENVVYGSEVEATSTGIKLENLAISVAASNKVSVYAYSYEERYTEGMLVLPVPSLGIDYMVVNLYTGYDYTSTQTIIIAVENDTEVNIKFKFTSNSQCSVDNTNYYNGDSFDFILNEYDVLNIKCTSDNTGSRITSIKPIGVITGSRLLKLPIDSRTDPTMEMLPPVTEFGIQFSLIAPKGHTSTKSMLRVVPLNSGTSFEIKGELYTPLKGEAVDNYLTESEKICFNATDKVIVVIFMLGVSYTHSYTGDVYMSLVPPVDRATNDYVVFNNVLKSSDVDYKGGVNIVAQNSVTAEITPTLSYEQLCNDYKVYSKTMKGSRVNHYHAPSPFLLLIYGYSFREAFGFPAGMKLSDFSGADDCASSPCQNGGWCIDTTTSFRCHCEDSRYSGTFCEIDDVDDCLLHQCQNGDCVDVGSSYKCICYADYTGDMCDTEIYYDSTTIIPTTEHPTTTDEPTTEHPTTTDGPTTEHPSTTDGRTTVGTEHPTTTDEPTTEHPTTAAVPTTEHPTTTVPTTEHPTTTVSTSEHPTTTDEPTTEHPITTDVPTTEHSTTTDEPTTEHPTTTDVPTTEHSTTTDVGLPNTEHPTTTDIPTTEHPTTTDVPTTKHPTTTDIPTTEHPTTTDGPTTEHPTTTDVPTTKHPTTTDGPTTEHPTTTDVPSTEHPTTTDIPTTEHPTTTDVPSTEHPTTTDIPTTKHPTTTDVPTTENPTTIDVPSTGQAITTDVQTTEHKTTTIVTSTEHTAIVTLEISNNRTANQSDIRFLPIYFKYRACNGNPCMCKCPCNQVLNRTKVLVHAKEQQNQLLVEKKSLSKTVRRKKSSENLTTAETNLGLYTVVVIFIMVSGVVILDSIWFFAWIYEKIKQYKERDRRSTDEEVFEN